MNYTKLQKLYFSDNINDMIEFYKNIKNYNDLLKFIKSIPLYIPEIYISNSYSRNDIIMVAPTPDHSNSDSIKLSEAFNEFKIIFVESAGERFNFANSMNTGIEKALTYNPQWIILANIDSYPMCDTLSLREKIQASTSDILVPQIYDERNKLNELISLKKNSWFIKTIFKYGYYFKFVLPKYLWGQFIIYKYNILNDVSYYHFGKKKLKANTNYNYIISKYIFSRQKKYFINLQPFSIIRSDILQKNNFDTDFINGGEDTELSIRLLQQNYKLSVINFKIRRGTGTYLGVNLVRLVRYSILANILLAKKLK